jgi:hypothetical protein
MTDYDAALAWFQHGVEEGWITDAFCSTHDGPPVGDNRELMQYAEDFEDGGDPCLATVVVLFAMEVGEP